MSIPEALFREVLARPLDYDFLRITTGGRDLQFVPASLSSASPQRNLRIFQIFHGKSVSEKDFLGQTYLVKLYGSPKLVTVVFFSMNPGLGFIGFFLQRRLVTS